ncbi:hypothetical protein [Pilimelia columellifera]|uniref:Uncharacterized protein n=1 Tax=Pilimelia columellifera subsp. columellifera TaxID=706583 RepID=A0ABP6A5G0_9ACTN
MTITTIDRHHTVHACTGDPVDTATTVVHTVDGGPCHQPVTIRAGSTLAVVSCGRVKPAAQQCHPCRPIVVVREVTYEVIDCDTLHGQHTTTVATGHSTHPCRICDQPLSAILAGLGRHILCGVPLPLMGRWK